MCKKAEKLLMEFMHVEQKAFIQQLQNVNGKLMKLFKTLS